MAMTRRDFLSKGAIALIGVGVAATIGGGITAYLLNKQSSESGSKTPWEHVDPSTLPDDTDFSQPEGLEVYLEDTIDNEYSMEVESGNLYKITCSKGMWKNRYIFFQTSSNSSEYSSGVVFPYILYKGRMVDAKQLDDLLNIGDAVKLRARKNEIQEINYGNNIAIEISYTGYEVY